MEETTDLRVFFLSDDVFLQKRLRDFFSAHPRFSLQFSNTIKPPCNWDIAVLPVELLHMSVSLASQFPVIFSGPGEYIIEAMGSGAIDYLKDEWQPDELYIRLHRYTENKHIKHQKEIPSAIAAILNYQESTILTYLLSYQGQPVSRIALQLYLWGRERPQSRGIDMHISSLRKKLTAANTGKAVFTIETVHGCGYLVRK